MTSRRSILATLGALLPALARAQAVVGKPSVSLQIFAPDQPVDEVVLLPNGSLWLDEKCVVDQDGNCKVKPSELHRILLGLADTCRIFSDEAAGPEPLAAFIFQILKDK